MNFGHQRQNIIEILGTWKQLFGSKWFVFYQQVFNNFVYFRIYAGANAAPVINGTSVTMAASSTLDVYVISISGTLTNVYLIGEPKNVADGPITLSRYPEPT